MKNSCTSQENVLDSSVLATDANDTVQCNVNSIDAGMPVHVASTCPSPLFELDAATQNTVRGAAL